MKQFIATSAMRFREFGSFGLVNLIGVYLVQAIKALMMTLIWQQLTATGGDANSMSLDQLISYTLLSTMLQPLLNVRTPVSSWLHEGTLLSLYQRPMGVLRQLAALTWGEWCSHLLVLALPLYFFLPISLPRSGWFYPSLLLSVVQGFCVDFLFACLIVQVANMSWQIECLRSALTGLLTGALIPFSLLPWGLGTVLSQSPLGTLAGAPLALYVGTGQAAQLLPAQVLWTALLLPLSIFCFQRSTERMMSYGG